MLARSGTGEELPAGTRAVLAAIRAAEGPDGRLPAPSAETLGEPFPFEGVLRVKGIAEPAIPEPPRAGEGGQDCKECERPDEDFAWTSKNWRLLALPEPHGLPAVLLLEPRDHFDLGDLPHDLAAEFGVLVVHIERAVAGLEGVGRVHVNRWGDGGAHLHVWFLARPLGVLALRGSTLPLWLDVLPPLPAQEQLGDIYRVAGTLAASWGGRARGTA